VKNTYLSLQMLVGKSKECVGGGGEKSNARLRSKDLKFSGERENIGWRRKENHNDGLMKLRATRSGATKTLDRKGGLRGALNYGGNVILS